MTPPIDCTATEHDAAHGAETASDAVAPVRHDSGARAAVTTRRRMRWTAAFLLALYVIALVLIAMWPTPVDRDLSPQLAQVLAWLHRHGAPGFVDYSFVERAANVLLFVPAGLLSALLLPRHLWWLSWAVCIMCSCLIELAQLLLLPARFATFDDVLMNTLGALIGIGFAALVPRR